MLDLQSYLLYELLLARRREVREEEARRPRRAQAPRFRLVPWAMTVLGTTLVSSGRKLQRRYEPMVRPRPQTSN